VLYPTLKDKETGYIQLIVDPNVFPPALRGLMVAAFAAAYMSTVATQLNWGASYLINDVYKRFWVKQARENHYIRASQLATVILMVASCVVTYYQTSVSEAWKLLLAIGAGTGSVQILRWFWWRLNAWSEVSAMAASLVVSLFLQSVMHMDTADPRSFGIQVLITVAISTVVWLAVTYATRPEPMEVLLTFYRRVRPNATFWGPVARQATDVPPVHDGRANLLDWIAGCVMVYLALFGVGKLIFGEYGLAALFLTLSAAAAVFLYTHLNRRGWKVIAE
jgi:SSS family solute:Na+ symporter